MKKNLIVKHNDFIEAKYNLTLTELKIIAKLSSMIKKDDDDFKVYKFTANELMEDLKLNNNYDDLKENEYFIETKLGDYLAYVTCKLFEDKMLLQYEWYLVIAEKKIVFYYSMMDNLSDLEKDSQYNEVLKILNTIGKKS